MRVDNHLIDEALSRRRILITCGTGGVGKTTLSAALATRAALLGKKAVVITMDPAKRLATSLGLESLGDHPTDLTPQLRAVYEKVHGRPPEKMGSISAIMPDTRRTFETFIRELSPNPAVTERVIRNPIFEIFAKEFSGTNEYMALERLFALDEPRNFDCIILDTPPSRNTLEFLDAPKLLSQFFDERIMKWLVLPANRLLSVGMKKALGILEHLTGAGFMGNLFEFAQALFEVRTGFSANLQRIIELLESDAVGFLMVAAPAPDLAPEALRFVENLNEHRFHFDGLILNRTLGYLGSAAASKGPSAAEKALRVVKSIQAREDRIVAALSKNPFPVCARLPELARDVHSLEDLFHVAMALDPARTL